jgi:hypothetical protein
MKVLFATEKYCDSNPGAGPTNSEHLLVGSLKSTGLVDQVKHFYFDEVEKMVGKEVMGRMLVDDCRVFGPDLVVLTPLGGPIGYGYNPSQETMLEIRDALGIKVLLISFDVKPNCRIETERLPFASHIGLVGSIRAAEYYRSYSNMSLFIGTADPGTYYDMNLDRDIDISFVGSVDPSDQRWVMRNEYIHFLRNNGINIFVGGGQRGQRLETERCCEIFSRSKLSLNFCRDGDGFPNLKSRVFEVTACGAMLLEDWDSDAARLFGSGAELVIYHSKEDLLNLIRYYLEHYFERETIARAGQRKTVEIYNPRNQWAYALERMGFGMPPSLASDSAYLQFKQILEELHG